MKKIFFGILLVSTQLSAQTKSYPIFPDPLHVKEYTLKNGLKVMLSENHNSPEIFGVIAVKAGGKNDPKEATGMAHYLEHMLFKGTDKLGTWDYEKESVHLKQIEKFYEELGQTTDLAKRADIQQKINEESLKAGQYAIPNEMDRMLSEIGGTNVNAFTTNDFTAYHNSFPSNKLEQWLQIYDHRFENPVFRLFQSELETVYEEKNRGMDTPFNYVFEEFLKTFWKTHPYGQQSIIGSTEHLKNPSLQKMYEYYNTYYVANNMVLCLSGDFDSETTIQLIESYFSDWRTGEIPVFPKFEEKQFNGNESITVKATPVKGFLRGYRTPENGSKDQLPLSIANYILSNPEGSGLLNNLTNEGKITMAEFMPMDNNDYSAGILIAIPKIIGQSFEDAEILIDAQFKKLINGEFSDDFFEGAKISVRKDFEKQLESNDERALMMMSAFTSNMEWSNYIAQQNLLKYIKKNEVVEIAKKYYGDNYFTLYSKMGTPPKDKLSKPKFEPVIPQDGKMSEFYTEWRTLETTGIEAKFIDFNKDITATKLSENLKVTTTNNPFNEIFSMKINWGIGFENDSLLKYTSHYLNKLGTKDQAVTEFKNSLFQLGATINFSAQRNEFMLNIEGMDDKMDETMKLVHNFITNYEPSQAVITAIREEIASERKLDNSNLQALTSYALYKDQSIYLKELSTKDLKSLKAESLTASFENVKKHSASIEYTGKLPHETILKIFKENTDFNTPKIAQIPAKAFAQQGFDSPKVYFLHDKKAVQSQIMFLKETEKLDLSKTAMVNAFNTYFGGDMSSLVFQEIREFRSLAYSTYALYRMAPKANHLNTFIAFVGCQADKTPEALSTMFSLIQEMPAKTEREKAVKDALISNAKSSYPAFRDLIDVIQKYENMGYEKDPNVQSLEEYEKMNFDMITAFYKANIQEKPYQICIVGNKKKVDIKELAKYGKVISVKKSSIIRL